MEKAGALLHALFNRLSVHDERGFVRFFSSWRAIAGSDLADHSKLVDVRHNAAVVVVDHPGWMQLLRMQQERILKRIQHEFPDLEIRTLHFHLVDERVGHALNAGIEQSVSVPDVPDHGQSPTVERGGHSENPDEALSGIADPELKDRLSALKKAIESTDR